ncbi:Non-heme 11 kDa protein of cytochrome bc1 complex [Choiromyces venosus 120613-1]|uniref:Cytochrome b-c1 complex subunit 6, mitochondrial n=1 Tax=Choiromyces venosus 120613-1 TaxID=1336337 RepID=A0A3N4K033_9PEZI|nr:Non-heme 11 kDa protein of cytochrome bc1 complex [Choiromyces venosus 120613-1]
MPLSSLFSDIYTSLTVSPVHADAPPAAEEQQETPSDSKAEETKPAEPEPKVEEPAQEEEAEEEAEEEEPEDPMPAITDECSESKECKPAKHHYDECVDRVTAAAESEAKGPKEDCVEEFFHLMHCSAQCAAPKLWAKLK